jgi:trk system potassium uptake protein TrkH
VEVFGRALPDALVKKAAALAFGMFALIITATLVLDMTENIPFEPLVFEVISASTTTGLSLGATDDLTPAGRVVLSVTMFVGRVGPLAFLGALVVKGGGSARGGSYHYPRDSVSLG